jgi:oligopeptide transport system substrate-binding protein
MKKFLPLILILISGGGYFLLINKNSLFHKKENVLKVVVFDKIKTLDPAIAFNDDLLKIISQSYETLFQYHYLKRPYEVIPSLAAEMPKISSDGTIYEIKIKKNIFYHDLPGVFSKPREVKAQDFINQIKRLAFKPLQSTGTWLFSGKIKGFDDFSNKVGDSFDKMLSTKIEGLSALDDHTIRIELLRPEPNMLYFLSMYFTAPIPEKALKFFNNDLSNDLYGTGPYVLKSQSNLELVFKKNKNYHDEFYPSSGDRYANTEDLLNSSTEKLPFINEIIFKVIQDEEERWEALIAGDLDILSVPTKYLVKLTEGDKELNDLLIERGIKVKHFSKLASRWLAFNMQDPIVGKNKNLRLAIAHGINYDQYIRILSNNTNLKANSIFNPSIPGYSPSHQMKYSFDLDKAKSYLKKAKLPKDFVLEYYTRGQSDKHFNEAEFIKNQLEKLGLKLKIIPLTFSDFLKKGRLGELQFFTDLWIYDYPDAENVLQLLISKNSPGINKSAYKNKKIDKLYDQLTRTLDKEKRYELMYQIEDIVNEEVPWIMMMFESSYILHYDHIKNFRKSYFIKNHFKYLKIE